MAKNNDNDQKKSTLARIKRTEAYAERVRTLFAATVNEILVLNKTMPELEEGEMFSFDAVSSKKQKEVERLLRQLHSVATMAIQSGIKLEWAQANAECDKLVQSCFGKKALETPEFTAWTQRNEAAMSAFIARSEKGLNLSQRVWKSCKQLRDEMEVAITVAVGDGTSAASMSRSVRKYLNDPDLMFRRFRYKAGEETIFDEDGNEVGKKIIWGKKWKKKIRKPDGTVGWIDYDKSSYQDEWTGPGYYKSSAQNAMRVARTETNIAYRRADNARWQQMDFVLGQRVQLSRNHPKKDICDKLAGDYPPEFVFDGWHPQCFCMVTPILMNEDEILKMNEAMLEGKEYKPRGKRITQYPDNFKQWVRDNEEKIMSAHDYGSDPYFVRNNFNAVQDILNPKKQLTPLEIAEQRHANRTPEQEEAIRLKWQERQERIAAEKQAAEAERLRVQRINNTANNVLKVATTRFADLGIDTVALEAAIKSGDTAIIKAETRALAQVMAKKQKQIKTSAKSVLEAASKLKDLSGLSDVSDLSSTLNNGSLYLLKAQSQALQKRVEEVKKKLSAMTSITDVYKWAEEFTVSQLELADQAIAKMFKKHSGESLESQLNTYKFEAGWKKDHPKYVTDKVVQEAYEQKVKELEHEIKWKSVKDAYTQYVKKYSSTFPTLVQELTDAINADNLVAAEAAVIRLQSWDKVITERARIATALGAVNAGMLKDVDAAIRAKDVTAATAALKTLDKIKDIINQRGALVSKIGAEHSALFAELDDAIANTKPIVAKKAIAELERWALCIEQLKKSVTAASQTKELKKLVTELKSAINAKNITKAEAVADKMKLLTMSPLEVYCEKHYTDKFTVCSQDSYDNVMTEMGKVSQPIWKTATEEEKQAFVDYCDGYSYEMLCDMAANRSNERVDRIDKVMKQIKYPHDIVLRSGQDFCMAEYVFNKDFRELLENNMIDELNAKYAGLIGTNVAYMSTSFNEKGGFSKDFEFHLFCPKGTSMMNVYVLSPYGGAKRTSWDGASYPKSWSPTGETEIFLGRNLLYKFIRAERGTGKGGTTRLYIQVVGTSS